MTLKLYFHPLSSFCQKALVALYENDTPFEPVIVDLGDPAQRDALLKLWPIGKFPVLRDEARDRRCRNRTSSSSIWRSIIRAGRSLCRLTPTSHGRRACATASTTSM